MFVAALLSQILLLLYNQLISTVNLFPFNHIHAHDSEDFYIQNVVATTFLGLAPFGFFFQIPILMVFGTGLIAVHLVLELVTWWVPYLSKPTIAWSQTYNRIYKPTLVLLPGKEKKTVPNTEHVVLHGLALLTLVLSTVYLVNSWPIQ